MNQFLRNLVVVLGLGDSWASHLLHQVRKFYVSFAHTTNFHVNSSTFRITTSTFFMFYLFI
jgi:hypothetical protein